MELAWGEPFGEVIGGLDIAGVRGLDQRIEAALVNGITTISPRGRYFTMLCWALGEFFTAEKAGDALYDPDRLGRFLARVEFLVLACTVLDPGKGEDGGALGRLTFQAEMAALAAGRSVRFADGTRSAMLAAYFGPCRALGLLGSTAPGSPVGFAVTPRGQQAWKARSTAMADAGWASALGGEVLEAEAAAALVPHFSLKRLPDFPEEADALRQALAEPWPAPGRASPAVAESYANFQRTLAWLREQARERGTGSLGADALLHAAWSRAARSGKGGGGIEDAWAECEWRRRLHFAVELVVSSVADTVRSLGSATLGEVVEEWLRATPADAPVAPRLAGLWPEAALAIGRSGRDAVLSVPEDLLLEAAPPRDLAALSAGARALAAFAMAACLARQSAPLRSAGTFRDFEATGERTIACIEEAGDGPFGDTLQSLAGVAAGSHLSNTLRKMSSGQRCSLRFFPEGSRLLALETPTGAGRSGSRLWNVVGVLRDAGEPGIADA
jgi:hypothetical protein